MLSRGGSEVLPMSRAPRAGIFPLFAPLFHADVLSSFSSRTWCNEVKSLLLVPCEEQPCELVTGWDDEKEPSGGPRSAARERCSVEQHRLTPPSSEVPTDKIPLGSESATQIKASFEEDGNSTNKTLIPEFRLQRVRTFVLIFSFPF